MKIAALTYKTPHFLFVPAVSTPPSPPPPLTSPQVLSISAAADNETAKQTVMPDGVERGVFTNSFVTYMTANHDATWESLNNCLKKKARTQRARTCTHTRSGRPKGGRARRWRGEAPLPITLSKRTQPTGRRNCEAWRGGRRSGSEKKGAWCRRGKEVDEIREAQRVSRSHSAQLCHPLLPLPPPRRACPRARDRPVQHKLAPLGCFGGALPDSLQPLCVCLTGLYIHLPISPSAAPR